MKKTCFILLSVELFFGAYALAGPQVIELSGRKDRVLSAKTRSEVLAVAEAHLNKGNGNGDFIVSIEDIGNPYAFKKEVEVVPVEVAAAPGKAPRPAAVAPVVYNDASVLKVIATNFSKQVRGTLGKGSSYYLQLQGGGLLKAGTSFPAKIPQAEGQSFTVTVSEVDSLGYTLQLGDASLVMSFNATSGKSSRAITLSRE
jgi:uncharacterized protein GlcG (DUF336 family)